MAYKEIDESNIILIDSVSSFIENIKRVKEMKESEDGTSTELYFRGQETEFWDIEPSIFRDDMLSIEHKLMQIPLQKSPTEFRDLPLKQELLLLVKTALWNGKPKKETMKIRNLHSLILSLRECFRKKDCLIS